MWMTNIIAQVLCFIFLKINGCLKFFYLFFGFIVIHWPRTSITFTDHTSYIFGWSFGRTFLIILSWVISCWGSCGKIFVLDFWSWIDQKTFYLSDSVGNPAHFFKFFFIKLFCLFIINFCNFCQYLSFLSIFANFPPIYVNSFINIQPIDHPISSTIRGRSKKIFLTFLTVGFWNSFEIPISWVSYVATCRNSL